MNVERASKEVVTAAATAVSRDRPCSKTLEWAVTRVCGRAAAQTLWATARSVAQGPNEWGRGDTHYGHVSRVGNGESALRTRAQNCR